MPMKMNFKYFIKRLSTYIVVFVSLTQVCVAHEVDDLKVLAKQGDLIAMFKLGALYYNDPLHQYRTPKKLSKLTPEVIHEQETIPADEQKIYSRV